MVNCRPILGGPVLLSTDYKDKLDLGTISLIGKGIFCCYDNFISEGNTKNYSARRVTTGTIDNN